MEEMEEIKEQTLKDYEVMLSLVNALNEIEQWVIRICTQKWPYEGCPRGYLGSLVPLDVTDKAALELYEFANRLYDKYLEEIDTRRSR